MKTSTQVNNERDQNKPETSEKKDNTFSLKTDLKAGGGIGGVVGDATTPVANGGSGDADL